jgi:hypothetical protein
MRALAVFFGVLAVAGIIYLAAAYFILGVSGKPSAAKPEAPSGSRWIGSYTVSGRVDVITNGRPDPMATSLAAATWRTGGLGVTHRPAGRPSRSTRRKVRLGDSPGRALA